MNSQDSDEKIDYIDRIKEKTIKKQFRQIYLDQEIRRKAQERKDKFLEKWGYIFACCLV